MLEVVWYLEKWEWYTLDNRLLWVFQELEKAGKISYIEMRRIEFLSKVTDHPECLYDSINVVDIEFEEPSIDRPPAIKGGKKSKDVKLLSNSLHRLHLYESKCTKKRDSSHPGTEKDSEVVTTHSLKENDSNATAVGTTFPEEMRQENGESPHEIEGLDLNHNAVLGAESVVPCDESTEAGSEDFSVPLKPMEDASSIAPVDAEECLHSDNCRATSEAYDILIKEEIGDDYKDDQIEDVFPMRHSRSPSVCSSLSDSRGVDDWGRKDKKPSVDLENSGQPSDEEWIEIESIQDESDEPSYENDASNHDNDVVFNDSYDTVNDDKAKEAVQAWLIDRKKFCKNSKNFHEYVVDNIDPKKPKKSLSNSLLSLDSAFSSASASSSISREQRQFNLMSGLFGYGNFDKYNTDYLSKLRAERLAAKRRLKPYDAANSRHARVMSFGKEERRRDNDDWRVSSRTVVYREERVKRRTFSETVNINDRSSHRYRSFSSTTCRSMSWSIDDSKTHGRRRHCSEPDSLQDSRRWLQSAESRRRKSSSRSFSGSSSHSFDKSMAASVSSSLKNHSLSKESLYALWQKRREEYLKARYRDSSSRRRSLGSLAVTGYTCGLCFKSFKTRTRREQHSDELMHWACITCGRFFASHTALGQHVDEVGHRKD